MIDHHPFPPGPAANWRQVADAAPALAKPITVAEWWKNRRGESIRLLVLNRFEGRNIFDLRTWFPGDDGRLKPGKGFAAEVRHLPRLAAAFARAEAKARELGLITDKGAAHG
jgi:Transcriptional Coactivator p15 (PC4)